MECGEECVAVPGITGITMMAELCAGNWGTMSIMVEVSSYIGKRIGDVTMGVRSSLYGNGQSTLHLSQLYFLSLYTS